MKNKDCIVLLSYLISLLITAVTDGIVSMPPAGLTGTWRFAAAVRATATSFTLPAVLRNRGHLRPKKNK